MWVIKLGGSLARSPELGSWLAAIVVAKGPVRAVVPGGGPFADQVRELQRACGFGDRIAHRMALLAMAQYGWLLHGLEPRLAPAPGLAVVREVVRAGRVALWLPRDDDPCNDALPNSWEVTSDSLALWLGRELGAEGVALVKSTAPPGASPYHAPTLADSGYLDACFAGLLAGSGLRACWFRSGEAHAIRTFDGAPTTAREILP